MDCFNFMLFFMLFYCLLYALSDVAYIAFIAGRVLLFTLSFLICVSFVLSV